MDFLASIAPPVMSQPQAFSDAMLDPASRGIMTGLTTAHMSGTTLQSVVRQSADQLQRTVQGQFVSLKVRNTLTTDSSIVFPSKQSPLSKKIWLPIHPRNFGCQHDSTSTRPPVRLHHRETNVKCFTF